MSVLNFSNRPKKETESRTLSSSIRPFELIESTPIRPSDQIRSAASNLALENPDRVLRDTVVLMCYDLYEAHARGCEGDPVGEQHASVMGTHLAVSFHGLTYGSQVSMSPHLAMCGSHWALRPFGECSSVPSIHPLSISNSRIPWQSPTCFSILCHPSDASLLSNPRTSLTLFSSRLLPGRASGTESPKHGI